MSEGARLKFYTSSTWQRTRDAYKKSVGGLCERCLKAGLVRPGVIVHHKIHLEDDKLSDPTISLSHDNLELLCRECHAAEHAKKRYVIDANGFVYGR